MRLIALAFAAALLLAAPARAADPELSLDTKRMLAYGTLAVMTKACNTTLTPSQSATMMTGLEQASQAQQEMNEAEFTEAMKAVGAQVGANKAEVCAALTPEFINKSLKEAAAGE